MPTLLVTGANRGLGLEFVRQYAADGWRVLACCRTLEGAATLRDVEGAVETYILDVANFPAIEKLAADLKGQTIDVLLNNAGIYGSKSSQFGSVDYDEWLRVLHIDTMAPLKMAESFIEHVAKSELKRIVTVSSKMGSIADNTSGGSYVYRSSKGAVNVVTKSMANDLKSRGVTCAVLHPGWVMTDMGGPNALISAEESVRGMKGVIDGLDLLQSGKFFNYDGNEIPW